MMPPVTVTDVGRQPEQEVARTTGDVWRRHPADVARLVLALLALAVLLAIAGWAPDAVRNTSQDLVDLVRRLPRPVTELLLGIAQLFAFVAPPAIAVWLVTRRRFRLAGTALVAATVAGVSMALLQGWLDRLVPPVADRAQASESWFTGAEFPSGSYLASFTAAVVVLGAASTRRWRRVGWWLVAVGMLLRVAAAVAIPVNVFVTVAIGAAAASAALVALGAPMRRIGTATVLDALHGLGIPARDVVEVDVGAWHSRTFRTVDHDDGSPPVFVKLIGWDERAAESLQRLVRAVRVRGIEDEHGERTSARVARQEALAGLLAARAGVRVAEVLAVGQTPEEDGIVVLAPLAGRRLAEVPAGEIGDDLLREAWTQLALLHGARIAHRWFDASSLFLADDGSLHVLDLRWAVVGADDELLAIDVVDLAVSLALLVGPERAVAAADGIVPEARVRAALPLTQPLVLSPSTRRAAKGSDDAKRTVTEVRVLLAATVGEEDVELAKIARLSVGRIVGWVGTAVLLYVGLAFASNWSDIADAIADANWAYVPPMLVLSVLGYVGGALSLIGAVPRPLPLGRTVQVMYAQSFLNRFTPANAGGMALRARYLQINGSDLTVAAASVGLTSAASGVLQAVLLVVFAVWAGSSDSLSFQMPDIHDVAVLVFVVALVVGVVLATSWGRRVIIGKLWPSVRKAVGELATLAKSPSKLAALFGGAFLGKITTIVSFVLACRAFDVPNSFAHLGLLYMTANTVASAVPTPGGVGAIEAALVAVLTGIGVDPAEALSIVMVFRLISYWLPVLPSWFFLQRLRKVGVV